MDSIDWQFLLTDFNGRINRAKFWIGVAAIWVIEIVYLILASILPTALDWLLFLVVLVAVIWAGLAVSIKRWHDRGKSGWWVLITLIPLVGPIWALVETGFLEGDKGDNEYGPDPLATAG